VEAVDAAERRRELIDLVLAPSGAEEFGSSSGISAMVEVMSVSKSDQGTSTPERRTEVPPVARRLSIMV